MSHTILIPFIVKVSVLGYFIISHYKKIYNIPYLRVISIHFTQHIAIDSI